MWRAVADTHAVIWYLFGDRRLSSAARTAIESAIEARDRIGVSSISLAEMIYLVEKGRIPQEALPRLLSVLDRPDSVLADVPCDRQVAEVLLRIDRKQVPDFPDRLIVATALHLGVPLVSRDARIRVSGITTIW